MTVQIAEELIAPPPVAVLNAAQCEAALMQLPFPPTCWLLWDRDAGLPFLCGIASSPGPIRAHLVKDHVRDGRIGLTWFFPELLDFVMARPPGFLGVSLFRFDTLGAAKICEQSIVAEFGRREAGGILFNMRAERAA
ncbi:hypothetical protein [Roseobacter sp. HKCCA0434]|uniref:hypothetical protein n=1 Tax=Roseobacter sp. HKCCA0434 TaxID=3079297 RepID=UPI002905CC4B|nr:hypothetical protein [Roseobacter sp. HKCCA0434]